MSRKLASALFSALLATTAVAGAAPAAAQVMRSEPALNRTIFVPVNKSMSFRLDQPATKIVVAQPETAETVATSDRSFYVRGVAVGSTNMLVYGAGGRLMQVIDVRVGYDARALETDLASAFPGEGIRVQPVGEGVMLLGDVSTSSVATRAKLLADKFAPNAASTGLTVRASSEVVLEVRILEATKSALQDLGFGGMITNQGSGITWGSGLIGNVPANGVANIHSNILPNVGIDVTLQALEEKGIVRTLARPNLVALSGEKASFLAGGEFPFPVPQDLGKITIEFRTYGVKLDFKPTVQDNGLIRLSVAPEVSQLDTSTAVRINGITIPGLLMRRADTTVELKNGESLAIGGLMLHNYVNDVKQFPVLGSMPILGALFRSTRWKRDETELIIIVTPRTVAPADFAKASTTTTVGGPEPFAADLILNGHALDKPFVRDRGVPKPAKK